MGKTVRNFTTGRMNKMVDQRLVPNGEYVDALNVRMGSTENSEIGVIENSKGNIQLTTLTYIDGTALSANARTIGTLDDGANETIYWMVHDPSFSLGNTGKLDLIVSYNTVTNEVIYHVVSIDDGGGANTVLNFNPTYLITGLNKIQDLLFFTDYYNQPRVINVKTNYPNPSVSYIDNSLLAEMLLVIKRPPMAAPTIQPIYTAGQQNFMEDRFLCFAYRYRYDNDMYSATSQFSEPAFLPKNFQLNANSFLNDGMLNYANAVQITYNRGSELVIGIDILFKDATNNVIKVVEKLNSSQIGTVYNQDLQYTFSNSKIFTILPDYELLRLFDNVPLLAKAQTRIGNRLVYSQFVEGYDLIDHNGDTLNLTYIANIINNTIGQKTIPDNTCSVGYTINGSVTIPKGGITVDLTGVNLIAGSVLLIKARLNHKQFSGASTPAPTQTATNIDVSFSFFLPQDYTSAYEMATSDQFISVIGTIANIKTVATSCDGQTFTDIVNCSLPDTLEVVGGGHITKYASGISGEGQPINIITTPSSNSICLQFMAMEYVDNTTTPTLRYYEYYEVIEGEAYFLNVSNPKSLHSNRGYEVGIVYEDEYGRSSTALVSTNNNVHVSCGDSLYQNKIQITIPITQVAPYWASKYKFVIKQDKEIYETIYCQFYFTDTPTGNVYFLLQGENARKVESGDRLIVKADSNGIIPNCIKTTVLSKDFQMAGFLANAPAGVYMKIFTNNFSAIKNANDIYSTGQVVGYSPNPNLPNPTYSLCPFLSLLLSKNNNGVIQDIPIQYGSLIELNFVFQRGEGAGCERRNYTLIKNLYSTADYDNFKDWWDGDHIELILNNGINDVGGIGMSNDTNTYINTLATVEPDFACSGYQNWYQFWRDTNNNLYLKIGGVYYCDNGSYTRNSTITASINVISSNDLIVFETEPSDALPDIFYENEQSYDIDASGNHLGLTENNDTDQVIASNIPAIINTSFFNCYTFGNGVESYKIRDSITGKTFNLGNRVTSVSDTIYKRQDRFADMTYSGVYNNVTNVNKLNEFNAGLLNFKTLEQSFGRVYVIDGRETDILVLQEDKISYVLTGKNLLSDSTEGGSIASVPEVLGTQIARTEKYGISFNAESYIHLGENRFFTDAKRGAVIMIKGNSHNGDQLKVISENGMRNWFRDEFINTFDSQKIGAFDPYMGEYVLSANDIKLPIPTECLSCGTSKSIVILASVEYTYCVDVGLMTGDVVITYIPPIAERIIPFEVTAIYNGTTVSSGDVYVGGTITVDKNVNNINTLSITISSAVNLTMDINVSCPHSDKLTIVEVVVSNTNDGGEFIHNEYSFQDGAYSSPVQSNLVTLINDTEHNPVISKYNATTGDIGSGSIPTGGSTMRMAIHKYNFDNYTFNASKNKFRYLISNILYDNNPYNIQTLLNLSTIVTPNEGSDDYNYSEFTVLSTGSYLYLIYDLRESVAAILCYSEESVLDVCCACRECSELCKTYFLSNSTTTSSVTYIDCNSVEQTITVNKGYGAFFCCHSSYTPSVTSGDATIELTNNCGCGTCIKGECVTFIVTIPATTQMNWTDCNNASHVQSFDEGVYEFCCYDSTVPYATSGYIGISYLHCGCDE